MKKIILSLVLLGSLSVMSCDKICVCYEPVNGVMTMNDVLASEDTRCNSLSAGQRICVEESERVDPGQIAVGFKGRK